MICVEKPRPSSMMGMLNEYIPIARPATTAIHVMLKAANVLRKVRFARRSIMIGLNVSRMLPFPRRSIIID